MTTTPPTASHALDARLITELVRTLINDITQNDLLGAGIIADDDLLLSRRIDTPEGSMIRIVLDDHRFELIVRPV